MSLVRPIIAPVMSGKERGEKEEDMVMILMTIVDQHSKR